MIAEGADATAMSRSIPLTKAMDDALLCLYQNGERVRPSNGYPLRLLLPGFKGNMNVKWLRRLKLTAGPAMTKDETSKYTILLKDEKAWQFVFPIEVKSVITRPSPGLALRGPGFYEISGLAWSGNAASGRSPCRLTADEAGRRQLCRVRSCQRRPCASAQRGNGMAGPPCCKVAPPTTRAWCSQRACSSPTSAACVGSTTTTPSQAGASTRWGRPAMFTLKPIAVCVSMLTIAPAALAQAPQFGQPIAPADTAAWDISIGPDGAGLPLGRGTAIEGEAIYVAKCQACHGEKGISPSVALAGALVGGMGSLAPDKTPIKTVGSFWPYATTLFDYIRRAMPFQESKSLTADELYAVSAYILNLNGIIGPNDVIDAQSLPKVRMPNRDGFIPFPRNPK